MREKPAVWVLFALLAIGLIGVARAVDTPPIPNPFPPGSLNIKTLPNGLRLVVREDHSLPIVAMVVAVRGGAAAENGAAGCAHYLEHLVFQGTKRYPGPLAPQFALEQVGGISNAVTSSDLVRYQGTIAAAQAPLLIDVLSDLVLNALLTDTSFEMERPTILAEIQRENDNPLVAVMNRAYSLTYPHHPYRHTPTGTIEDVLRTTPQGVRAFYRRWYVPNNMSVILVGDITRERASSLVERAFGVVPAGTLPTTSSWHADPPAITDFPHLDRPLPDTYQVLPFQAPSSRNLSAQAATDVIMTVLADGRNGLLSGWWVRNGLQVRNFGVEYISTRAPGRFMLWVQTDAATAMPVRDTTLSYLLDLAEHGVPDDTLLLAKQRTAAQFLMENETYSQQAATLAFYEGLGGAQLTCQYLPAVQAVTAQQVRTLMPTAPIGWITLGQKPGKGE